jgi:hypothetical protein
VPDDLHARYMAAHRAHQAHLAECTRCTDHDRCPDGQQLHDEFVELQDAYLKRLRRAR